MSKIHHNGAEIDIVTLAEALRRLGMFGKVRGAEPFHDDLVAYVPSAVADAGTGRLFAICGGRVLYAFSVVRKSAHLPDEPWAWRVTGVGRDIVLRIDGFDAYLELAVPA